MVLFKAELNHRCDFICHNTSQLIFLIFLNDINCFLFFCLFVYSFASFPIMRQATSKPSRGIISHLVPADLTANNSIRRPQPTANLQSCIFFSNNLFYLAKCLFGLLFGLLRQPDDGSPHNLKNKQCWVLPASYRHLTGILPASYRHLTGVLPPLYPAPDTSFSTAP